MKTKVRTSSLEKYLIVMPQKLSIKYCIAKSRDEATFEIDNKQLAALDNAYNKEVKKQKLETECSRFGTIGFAYEKQGKIKEAIEQYEKMLAFGCPETIYYERLMRIYRAKSDYKNEKRVLKKIMKLTSKNNLEIYKERLNKINKFLNE